MFPPLVLNTIVSPKNYEVEENIDILVAFNEDVIVETTVEKPRISLNIGGMTKYANYFSGNNSDELIFRYVVLNGDEDNNGIELGNSIDLPSNSSIKDHAGNDAVINLEFVASDNQILIDHTFPSVDSVEISSGNYSMNESIDVAVNFDEPVIINTSSDGPAIILTIGSEKRLALYQSGSGSERVIFKYIISKHDNDSNGIEVANPIALGGGSIQDTAGNNAMLSFNIPSNLTEVVSDHIRPSILGVFVSGGNYQSGQNIDVIVSFNENIVVNVSAGIPKIELRVGGLTKYAQYHSGSGLQSLVFRYIVEAGVSDSNGIELEEGISLGDGTIQDFAGNDTILTLPSPANDVFIDSNPPEITSVSIASDNYAINENLNVTVNFNEDVVVYPSVNGLIIALTIGKRGALRVMFLVIEVRFLLFDISFPKRTMIVMA